MIVSTDAAKRRMGSSLEHRHTLDVLVSFHEALRMQFRVIERLRWALFNLLFGISHNEDRKFGIRDG